MCIPILCVSFHHMSVGYLCTQVAFLCFSFEFALRWVFLSTARRKEARFTLLKRDGNDLVKQGHFQEALQKYSECLTLKPEECALYTNRYDALTSRQVEVTKVSRASVRRVQLVKQ